MCKCYNVRINICLIYRFDKICYIVCYMECERYGKSEGESFLCLLNVDYLFSFEEGMDFLLFLKI